MSMSSHHVKSCGSASSIRSPLSAGSRGSNSASSRRSASLDRGSNKAPTHKTLSKPSDRLNPKTINPFTSKGSQGCTAFASMYNSGCVPCRLVHGSVKHKLSWSVSPDAVPFDPLLVTLAEGIRETVHPYTFVARQGLQELLLIPSAGDKARPLLSKVVPHLRTALADRDDSVFEAGLLALVQLSNAVTSFLNPHLKMMLVPASKRSMEKKHKERVMDAMQKLEANGGKEAFITIKAKIPTYNSVNM